MIFVKRVFHLLGLILKAASKIIELCMIVLGITAVAGVVLVILCQIPYAKIADACREKIQSRSTQDKILDKLEEISSRFPDTKKSMYEKVMMGTARADLQDMYNHYKPLAEKGNAEAQRMVGLMHLQGIVVPQSNERAKFWFRKAIKNGDKPSVRYLSELWKAEWNTDPEGYVNPYKDIGKD